MVMIFSEIYTDEYIKTPQKIFIDNSLKQITLANVGTRRGKLILLVNVVSRHFERIIPSPDCHFS